MWGVPNPLMDRGHYADLMSFAAELTFHPEQFIERERESAWAADGFDAVFLKDGRVFERHLQPQLIGDECAGRIITFRDITRRKRFETEWQSHQAQLNALGPHTQSLLKVAQDISAPAQYVCDNLSFLQDAFRDLQKALEIYPELLRAAKDNAVTPELIARAAAALPSEDAAFLQAQVPASLRDTFTGISQILNHLRAFGESLPPPVAPRDCSSSN
jgi:hypothetical protein